MIAVRIIRKSMLREAGDPDDPEAIAEAIRGVLHNPGTDSKHGSARPGDRIFLR